MQIDRETPPLNSLYQELILDHYKKPRNKGVLENADHESHLTNPTCGDEVWLRLRLKGDVIEEIQFVGEGCSISQASISMMTQLVKGKSVENAHSAAAKFTALMHGNSEVAKDKDLGDLRALAGVSKFPVRVKCALLGWNALDEALKQNVPPQR